MTKFRDSESKQWVCAALILAGLLLLVSKCRGETLVAEFEREVTQPLRYDLGLGAPLFTWTFQGLTPSFLSVRGDIPNLEVDIQPKSQVTSITSRWACDNCYLSYNQSVQMSFQLTPTIVGSYGLTGTTFVDPSAYSLVRAEVRILKVYEPTWAMQVRLYGDQVPNLNLNVLPEPAAWQFVFVALFTGSIIQSIQRRSRR